MWVWFWAKEKADNRATAPQEEGRETSRRVSISMRFPQTGGLFPFHKITQNKMCSSFSWIRCLTVFAYFILVSSPALLFSFYYTRIWDPTYLNKVSTKVQPNSILNDFRWSIHRQQGIRRLLGIREVEDLCPLLGKERRENLVYKVTNNLQYFREFYISDILPKGTIGNG